MSQDNDGKSMHKCVPALSYTHPTPAAVLYYPWLFRLP